MKRRTLSIIALLLGGALMNIAATWLLSLTIDPFAITHGGPGGSLHLDRTGGRVTGDMFWFGGEASQVGAMRLFAGSRAAGEFDADFGDDPRDILPGWWRPAGWGPNSRDRIQAAGEARGWPMLAMWHDVEYADHVAGRGRMRSVGGIELSVGLWIDPMPFSSYDQPRTLPLRVILSGFAANTVFYMVVLWLLLCGPIKVRRWRRLRRGLCPNCGYPIGPSEACSECGGIVRGKGEVPSKVRTSP